ncbi:MAG: hypothetical protein QW781_03725 [Methanothrix sp.]
MRKPPHVNVFDSFLLRAVSVPSCGQLYLMQKARQNEMVGLSLKLVRFEVVKKAMNAKAARGTTITVYV